MKNVFLMLSLAFAVLAVSAQGNQTGNKTAQKAETKVAKTEAKAEAKVAKTETKAATKVAHTEAKAENKAAKMEAKPMGKAPETTPVAKPASKK